MCNVKTKKLASLLLTSKAYPSFLRHEISSQGELKDWGPDVRPAWNPLALPEFGALDSLGCRDQIGLAAGLHHRNQSSEFRIALLLRFLQLI